MHQIHAGSRSLQDAAKEARLEALGEVQLMPLLRRQAEISNGLGLHLRAANQFVRVSQQFQVEVRVFCNGHGANGRSILDLLCLAAECGDQLKLEVSGPDAEDAASALCELIEARFHEAAHVRDESPNEGTKGHH